MNEFFINELFNNYILAKSIIGTSILIAASSYRRILNKANHYFIFSNVSFFIIDIN